MQIEFLYPLFLLLLPLYFFIEWLLSKHFKRVEFSNFKLLQKAVKKSFDFSKILKLLIVLFIVLALATPVTKQMHQAKTKKGYDISLLLDASDSMQEDNRFNTAKKIIAKFLKERKRDNISLSLFANYAYVASPLTYDKSSIEKMLKYIKLGVAGSRETALYEALFLGADLFKKSSNKNRVMILLTDGIDTVGDVSLKSAIDRIKKNRIKVYTIALGKTGDYNGEVLQKIATKSGGKFYTALKPEELDLIYSEINKLERAKIESKSYTTYNYYFIYPLIVATILMLIFAYIYRGRYSKVFMALALIFMGFALYRPSSTNSILNTKRGGEFAVAIDLSYSMDAKDIYPDRLTFTKSKINTLLNRLNGEKVALYGFANSGYLISPFTKDYERLKYLVKNLEPIGIKRDKSDILALLKAVNSVQNNKSSIIVFTSTDSKSITKAISYANSHNIKVNIYAVATKNGTTVKVDGKVLKDNFGNIKIFKLKSHIKELALTTRGRYFEYSLSDDINKIIDNIDKNSSIAGSKEDKKELFWIPLLIAFAFFVLSLFKKGVQWDI